MSATPAGRDQAFPDRAVRVIDPFGAGGGVDVIARALASRLAAVWGQPVIVDNHPGAGSTAAPALVAQTSPDGYTLLINTSAQAYSAARASELPYHPCGTSSPSPRSPASPAVATLNRDLGIAAVHLPPAATDAITDVIAGPAACHTAYAMLPIPPAADWLRDGRLVALGVSTARRSRLLPDVPPLAEVGVTGFDFPIRYGIWAPAGPSWRAKPNAPRCWYRLPEPSAGRSRDTNSTAVAPAMLAGLTREMGPPARLGMTPGAQRGVTTA